MRYLTLHRNRYWFQIHVPAPARARYGPVVRLDLQTAEARTAGPLALRLAAEWLTRFSLIAAGEEPLPDPDPERLPPAPASEPKPEEPGTSLTEVFGYWRDLVPSRPRRTVDEFGATAELFDERVPRGVALLGRTDIAEFRDSLLRDGLTAGTVRKRLGFVRTMLQTYVDAGRLATNVAAGLRVPRRRVETLGRTEMSPEQLQVIFGSPVYSSRFRP